MKTIEKKTRTKIDDLKTQETPAARQELDIDQLRLVTGGMPMLLEPCSCTFCDDVDCD